MTVAALKTESNKVNHAFCFYDFFKPCSAYRSVSSEITRGELYRVTSDEG